MRFWLGSWVALAVFWVFLVDTLKGPELIAGAVAAALGATGLTAVRAERLVDFRPRGRWLLSLALVLPKAFSDLHLLAIALFRRVVLRQDVRGGFRAGRFRHGGDSGEATARRVLTKLAVSFTPNTYVLDVDEDSDLVLVHQLVVRRGRREDLDPLGLG